MGRFTLRDEGRTIALGKVLKYKPVKVTMFTTTTDSANQQTSGQGELKQGEMA
jgi:hypothetical protein